ncbi:MAG: flavodoxin family protein [Deltaproteobacteria bacterium]|jgi:flavodoxin|nr:flavodoxin family protein [Deltaproteobacteria bacterium]
MKVLVAYYSDTGNTKKVAEAIYDAISESEKEISLATEASDLSDYDLIFCGFPVQSMGLPGKMESFVKTLPEGKKVAFFATHGSLRGGELAITAFYSALGLAKNLNVMGTFGCRGAVKPNIIEAFLKKVEFRGWALEAQSAAGHPDEADLDDAKAFAEAMMTKARAK